MGTMAEASWPRNLLEFRAVAAHSARLQPQLTSADKRHLKGRAQLLEPVLKVGRNGIAAPFPASVETELARHELIKIKFVEFKEQKHELAARLAEETGSALVQVVGNVAVLYRPKPPVAL